MSDPRARARLLLVEDDENLRVALADNLQAEGYEVHLAADGASARRALKAGAFDLLLLDIMLPDTDGYTLCRQLRAEGNSARILMLTARTLEEDIVRGFDAGADDYVEKPYRLALLLARVRALLRRPGSPATHSQLHLGRFAVDKASRSVRADDGQEVELTPKEFDLLSYLLANRGRALSRHQILDDVWSKDIVIDARTIDNFVSSLKKKLGWRPDSGFRIQTVRGVGYRLELDGD